MDDGYGLDEALNERDVNTRIGMAVNAKYYM